MKQSWGIMEYRVPVANGISLYCTLSAESSRVAGFRMSMRCIVGLELLGTWFRKIHGRCAHSQVSEYAGSELLEQKYSKGQATDQQHQHKPGSC